MITACYISILFTFYIYISPEISAIVRIEMQVQKKQRFRREMIEIGYLYNIFF